MQTTLGMFRKGSQIAEYFRKPPVILYIPRCLSNHRAQEGVCDTLKGRRHDSMNIEPQTVDIETRPNNNFHVEMKIVPASTFIEDRDWCVPNIEILNVPQKRDWRAYNNAQQREMDLFEVLLGELVKTLPNTPYGGNGRPTVPLSEQIFCAVLKSYSHLSSRRVQAWIQKAKNEGHISFAPHYNVISKTLLNEQMTSILQELIRASALPLSSIEHDFAIDSSGFSCSSFSDYCGAKHGVKREHEWIKAHICTGVKTHIVTDVVVTDGNASDCPQFKDLLKHTSDGFMVSEVSADKAYSSKANLELAKDMGGEALIPFKSNVTGKARGSSTWKKAFHYFQLHRAEFDEHYHKRSNVESTFGAIKAKFGEHIKSKNFTAQKNELLCKILAYNITVLINEMFESGISPDF